jgi:hypothetical protein
MVNYVFSSLGAATIYKNLPNLRGTGGTTQALMELGLGNYDSLSASFRTLDNILLNEQMPKELCDRYATAAVGLMEALDGYLHRRSDPDWRPTNEGVSAVETAAKEVMEATEAVHAALPENWDDWTKAARNWRAIENAQEWSMRYLQATALELEVEVTGRGNVELTGDGNVEAIDLLQEIEYQPDAGAVLESIFARNWIPARPSPAALRRAAGRGRVAPHGGGHGLGDPHMRDPEQSTQGWTTQGSTTWVVII